MHVSAFETRDNPQSDVLVAEGRFLWWGGGGGRTSTWKGQGILIRKFELNPSRKPIWVLHELYLIPKRYHLRWIRLD